MIKNLISERYRHIEPSSMMKMAAVAAGIRGSIDLTLGEPDISAPPEICEALYEAAKGGATHYAPGMRLTGLRSAISEYWMRRYDLIYGIDEIFVTTGGSQPSFLALQAWVPGHT
ncbi:MAG: hypothetical protein LLF78_04235 [Synergistaceae bacterium]|nr:hypothetical protein [Synergistaceae bacterium]